MDVCVICDGQWFQNVVDTEEQAYNWIDSFREDYETVDYLIADMKNDFHDESEGYRKALKTHLKD